MKHTSLPQPIVPLEAQNLNSPVEPMPLAPGTIPESASTTATVPPAILEPEDDRYYADHWGINE